MWSEHERGTALTTTDGEAWTRIDFSWNICYGVVRVLEANIQGCGDVILWRSWITFLLHSAKPAWFTAVTCAKFHVLCNIWYWKLFVFHAHLNWQFNLLFIVIPLIFIPVCWWILFDLSKTSYCVFRDLFWTGILQTVTILQLIFRLMWYSCNKICQNTVGNCQNFDFVYI